MTVTMKTRSAAPLRDVTREFSLAEASYVLGQGKPVEINKLVHETRQNRQRLEAVMVTDFVTGSYAMETKVGKRQRAREGGSSGPAKPVTIRVVGELEPADLRYLKIVSDPFGRGLSPDGRKRLYASIRKLPLDEHRLSWGKLVIDLTEVDKELSAQIGQLEAIEQKVEQKGDANDPVLRGTNFSVYVIAALTRGQAVDEILDDYPGLTAEQVATAVEYEKAHPKIGRPYPTRSLKRGLAALDLGAIDEFLGDGDEDAEPGAPGE